MDEIQAVLSFVTLSRILSVRAMLCAKRNPDKADLLASMQNGFQDVVTEQQGIAEIVLRVSKHQAATILMPFLECGVFWLDLVQADRCNSSIADCTRPACNLRISGSYCTLPYQLPHSGEWRGHLGLVLDDQTYRVLAWAIRLAGVTKDAVGDSFCLCWLGTHGVAILHHMLITLSRRP